MKNKSHRMHVRLSLEDHTDLKIIGHEANKSQAEAVRIGLLQLYELWVLKLRGEVFRVKHDVKRGEYSLYCEDCLSDGEVENGLGFSFEYRATDTDESIIDWLVLHEFAKSRSVVIRRAINYSRAIHNIKTAGRAIYIGTKNKPIRVDSPFF